MILNKKLHRGHQPDFSDNLSFFWLPLLLFLFVLSVGALRFIVPGSLVSCWAPAQFTQPFVAYTTDACWKQERAVAFRNSTVEYTESMTAEEKKIELFHTRIPFVLILLIFGFKIPEGIWLIYKSIFNTNIGSTSGLGMTKQEVVSCLVTYIQDSRKECMTIRTVWFLLVKLCSIANLAFQLIFTLCYFRDTVRKVQLTETFENPETGNITMNITEITQDVHAFPSLIICEFDIRQFRNIQRWAIQCRMPINELYEAFVLLYWRIVLVVLVYTSVTFLLHVCTLTFPRLVGIRFRGLIPEQILARRRFGIDDSLLLLFDIQDGYGSSIAREVAVRIWEVESQNMTPMVQYHQYPTPTVTTYGAGSVHTETLNSEAVSQTEHINQGMSPEIQDKPLLQYKL